MSISNSLFAVGLFLYVPSCGNYCAWTLQMEADNLALATQLCFTLSTCLLSILCFNILFKKIAHFFKAP